MGPLLHSGLSTTLLQDFFNNPQTFLIINGGTSAKATVDPRLPDATYVLKFASYQEMQSAVAAGTIPSSIKFLAYDNEHWTATPKVEQQNPYAFEAEAEQLAHAHGFGFIFTPAANLSMDLSRSYTNATKYTGYVNLGIASHGAPYADIFEIQGQQDEALSGFSSFVSTAVGQAKAANPHAVILLGLTTKAPGQNVTTQLLMADYDFSRSEVAGYWLNIPGGHGAGLQSTQVAVTFLQSLAPQLGY